MLVQVVLFDGFDPLDAVAPFEVLHAAGVASKGALSVVFASVEGARQVPSGIGFSLAATEALDLSRARVLLIPGAVGPVNGDSPDTIPALLWRASQSPIAQVAREALASSEHTVATVCGGSLLLGMAGVIQGRRAVTHHEGMEALAGTGVHAIRARVVDDGNLVSAAGVTSGLDLGLYLTERLIGAKVAHFVETLFAYERRGVVWRDNGPNPEAL
jgi:transcriptional regulator GlxA family with amidase domain